MTWFLLVIVVIALIAVGCLSFRSRGITRPNFVPNSQNHKLIMVEGWNEAEIQKIIHDFIETYKNDGYPAFTIEPHQQAENVYRLTFPQDIHPLLFTFLVNFVVYPFDLDLTNHTIVVGGKTTLDTGFDGIDESLVGKRAILYVPENDDDHDVVYMQTESGGYLVNSFTWGTWKRTTDGRLSAAVKNLMAGVQ